MLLHDLDRVLGSLLKVRLLRAVFSLQKPVSGRHAGRLAGVSSKANGALNELAQAGLIIRTETTGQHLYSLNREHFLAPALIALFNAEETKVSRIVAALKPVLASRGDLVAAAIYGSLARGDAQPGSDLDLLLIVDSREGHNALLDVVLDQSEGLWKTYGLRLSPVVIAAPQWIRQLKAGDSFALSATADAKLIVGTPLDEIGER